MISLDVSSVQSLRHKKKYYNQSRIHYKSIVANRMQREFELDSGK